MVPQLSRFPEIDESPERIVGIGSSRLQSDPGSDIVALRALTLNHRNIGLQDLAGLALGGASAELLHHALSALGIESVVLMTCHRTEIYWLTRGPDDDDTVKKAVGRLIHLAEPWLDERSLVLVGEAALRHLFRVTCGIESLVLGESEILGQVGSAVDACRGAGPFLHGFFRAAIRAGRQARVETGIAAGALSVASMAVQWLHPRLPLITSRVLVVGAGETGKKAARHLRALGVHELVIANRTTARAEVLAEALDGRGVGLDRLKQEIEHADAVVCAVGGGGWVVPFDLLRDRAHTLENRPLFVIDLGMPAAVEPGQTQGLIRIDLSGLEKLTESHRQNRAAEVPGVEAVIERELHHLRIWARRRAVHPLASDLRRKVEAIRREELARAEAELPSSGTADLALFDRLSQRLIKRLLLLPLGVIEDRNRPLDSSSVEHARRLFALDAPPPK